MLKEIKADFKKLANPKQAKMLSRFFKTGKGGYGEGDVFLGLKVPDTRRIVKKYKNMELKEIGELLNSKIHEHRLAALLMLVEKYQKGDEKEKRKIYNFYLRNTKKINNWDLVDLSSHYIVGDYLYGRDKSILYKLARSKNLWERRIAVISTFAFIKEGEFKDALKIAEVLLRDEHDLIHKAVGWMLREVGKKDQETEEKFLKKHYKKMPRTMLRYAIERLGAKKRRFYMS